MDQTNTGKVTASSIISFAQELEDNSATFYRKLTEKYSEHKEAFLSFAKESEKNRVLLTRTYQETISDALEAGFSFQSLNLDNSLQQTTLEEDANLKRALKVAMELEKNASRFYGDAAEQSKSLLATIPRAFKKAAESRSKRAQQLESILKGFR